MSDDFYLSTEWLDIRYQALKRYGGACQCCGATGTTDNPLHVDHIKPRSRFPELALDITNLQVLCMMCNRGKGAADSTDWRCAARKQFVPRYNSKWTTYKKALICCDFIRKNGLANDDKWIIANITLPFIGMIESTNECNRITQQEAVNLFIYAVFDNCQQLRAKAHPWNSYKDIRGTTKSLGTLIWACKEVGMVPPWTTAVTWENAYLRIKAELEAENEISGG
jgi:hypothetical protein